MFVDNYSVDPDGNIKLEEKTDDKVDVLYTKESWDNGTKDKSVTVDKGVLDNVGEGTYGGEQYNSIVISNEQKGEEVFKFLADNTSVEWGNTKLGDHNNFTSVLTTTHLTGAEYGGMGVLQDPKFSSMSFIGNDHSHPNGDWQPSSSTLPFGDPGRKSGDIGYATRVETTRNPNAVLRVYDKKTQTSFTYNSKTFLPRELPGITIKPR